MVIGCKMPSTVCKIYFDGLLACTYPRCWYSLSQGFLRYKKHILLPSSFLLLYKEEMLQKISSHSLCIAKNVSSLPRRDHDGVLPQHIDLGWTWNQAPWENRLKMHLKSWTWFDIQYMLVLYIHMCTVNYDDINLFDIFIDKKYLLKQIKTFLFNKFKKTCMELAYIFSSLQGVTGSTLSPRPPSESLESSNKLGFPGVLMATV